jgi:uncharacterized protein
MNSYLADTNFWLALVVTTHLHHKKAVEWYEQVGNGQLWFCRVTQMGFLRLLTNHQIMGDGVLGQKQAWSVQDQLFADPRVGYLEEPPNLNAAFRRFASSEGRRQAAWTDAYIAAFAACGALTVATFDKGFREYRVPLAVLGGKS